MDADDVRTRRGYEVVHLGQMSYSDAYAKQETFHQFVLESRESVVPQMARLLMVEHVPPVITVTRRPGALGHLLASPDLLKARGIELCETDRGGDITYHGPGQLVCYPIVDLNAHKLKLHDYVRLLEASVIDTLAHYGVSGETEAGATGVWVRVGSDLQKVCAIGVRVRRWVTMHGLAINVATDLGHFGLIVPCGLAGRPVTSLRALLRDSCPPMDHVQRTLAGSLLERLGNV